MALVKTVEMRVLAKAGDAQEQLDEIAAKADRLDGDAIRMRFRVDDGNAKAQLDEIQARATELGFKDVSIKVKVDGQGRAIADLAAVKHEMDSVERHSLVARIGGLVPGGTGGLGPIPALPLPALAAAIPLVGALATEAVGVAAGFAAAGTGAGAFALLALPAVKSVTSAYQGLHAAQQKYQAAQLKEQLDPTKANQAGVQSAALNLKVAEEHIARLPASEQAAIRGIEQLSAGFGKMSRAFQPQAFKVFADGLKLVSGLLPHVTPFASTFAQGLDKLLQQASKFTQSKGFSDWLKQFHSLEGPAIQSIGHGIGEVANSFGKLMTVMSGKDVGHAINIAFGAISGTINVVTFAIRRFMQNWDGMSAAAAHAGHAIAGAFKSVVSGAVAFQSTVDGAFMAVIRGAERMVSGVVHTVASLPGKIKGLFAGAAGWLVGAGRAIVEGLIQGIEAMLGPLEAVASKVAGVVKKVGGWLGIHSPSTVMHGYGVNIIEGLMAGMNARLPALEKTAAQAAKIISDRIKTEIAYAKSVSSATLSGLGLTSIDLSQTTVAGGMQSYLASIKAFIAEIKQLSSQHLNKGILQQLIAAGPVTGGQYAQSIMSGGVGQVNSLYRQIQQQSAMLGAQAAMSVYGGKAVPKGDTYTISVSAGLITDKQAVAMEIVKLLRQYKRHGGGTALGIA